MFLQNELLFAEIDYMQKRVRHILLFPLLIFIYMIIWLTSFVMKVYAGSWFA